MEEGDSVGAGCLTKIISSTLGAGRGGKVGDGVGTGLGGSDACNGWKEAVVVQEELGEVVLGGEVVGNGLGEWYVSMVLTHVETRLGGASGGGHGDDEVRNGTGVGVHEAKTPMCTGDVCDEHGWIGDRRCVGETGQEVMGHGVNAMGKGAVPSVPGVRCYFVEKVEDFGSEEVWCFVHGTLGEEAH